MDTNEKTAHTTIVCDPSKHCPMVDFVNIISGKWVIPILYRLIIFDDAIRFGALQRAIGSITQKELTKHLRSLETLGLLTREVYPEVPPRVEYQITELGKSLKPMLDLLAIWMQEHHDELLLAKQDSSS